MWFRSLIAKEYKPSTIILYGEALRQLYQHSLTSLPKNEAESKARSLFECIPVRDLRRNLKKNLNSRDKLVMASEFESLMKVASHPRIKALIAVLYESGARKGEILSLKIRDISLDDEYTTIRMKGKTGERTIPLIKSVPYLRQWLQVHPDRDLESPLFATVKRGKIRQMSGGSVNCCLKRLCEKAKIRPIYPYRLRHTRLTELAKLGLGEYHLKNFAGWTMDSKMSARYLHLTGRAHINAVLEAEGVEVDKEKREEPSFFRTDFCPSCGGSVGTDMIFCPNCAHLLDERIQIGRVDEVRALRGEVDELRRLLKKTLDIALSRRRTYISSTT